LKHKHIPGLLNVFEVNEPKEIQSLANSDLVDRRFDTGTCPLNWLLVKRTLSVFSFRGHRFPTMEPRQCPARAKAQDELWRRLNAQVEAVKAGPIALADLADWVRGRGSDADIGILAQHLVGRLFRDDFKATPESWRAAIVLASAPRSSNPLKLGWWFVTGRVRRAKRLLAGLVNDDLSAVNGIGIAVHNLVKGLRQMRSLHADTATRSGLAPATAAELCLRAPVSLYRQAIAPGKLGDRIFSKGALFSLNIESARQLRDGRSVVFLENSWSRCPAASWVPAMLEGVWRRASSPPAPPDNGR
jgi:hypothetical protein